MSLLLTLRQLGLVFVLFLMLYATSSAQESSSSLYALSGTITEEKTGEAVISASVVLYQGAVLDSAKRDSVIRDSPNLPRPFRGALSNKYGFYSLSGIPEGAYTLVVRRVGFKTVSRSVEITSSSRMLNLSLTGEAARLQQVSVQADRQSKASISEINIPMEFLRQMPAIGGERDVFRTLQLLPGVKAGSELSSGLYIRGSTPDQNLILLDGVTVYNPQHLGGFLSAFNPDAVSDVRLIKGAFPAEYGSRLSSVIDLTMKEGSKEKIKGAAGISLISAKALLEGPIATNASFMVSARRMYFDIIGFAADPTGRDVPRYNFYDLNAKVNYRIDDNDHIFLSGYFGRDLLPRLNRPDETTFELGWGNATGNLRWTHIFSPSLFSAFSLIYTSYDFRYAAYETAVLQNVKQFETTTAINDLTFKGEMQWFPAEGHSVKSGIEATRHDFTVNILNSAGILQITRNPERNQPLQRLQALEIAGYAQDEWEITPSLSVNLGARATYFQSGSHFRFEPRAALAYKLSDETTLKGAYAMAHQFLHLLQENTIALPTDTWFPSTDKLAPSRSTHYVAALETYLCNREYFLTIEGYYKRMDNIYEFREGAQFVPGASIEGLLTTGTGEGYGAEIFLNKQIGAFTGWIGYTLSWAYRQFPEINGGRPFFPRFDRRHDITLALSYKLSEKWEVGATWTYATGQALTMPIGVLDLAFLPALVALQNPFTNATPRPFTYLYADRNSYRMPDYHRLDLNLMYKFQWLGLPFEASINIYNVYNRLNPFTVWVDERGNVTALKQYTLLPFLPTIGISCAF
jgi:hypothetical protein